MTNERCDTCGHSQTDLVSDSCECNYMPLYLLSMYGLHDRERLVDVVDHDDGSPWSYKK